MQVARFEGGQEVVVGRTGGAARAVYVVRNLPLAVSGAVRRFLTDPVRGRAALERAVPALRGRAGDQVTLLARFDRAVAEDRYDEARTLIEGIPAETGNRADAELALARIGGDLTAVERSTPQGARGRRARRVAAEQSGQLLSALPTWAKRHSDPVARTHAPPRVLHVVTNSLPLTQAGSTIRTHRVAIAQRKAGWDARAVTRPGYPVVRGHLDSPSFETYDSVPYARLLPAFAPSSAGEGDCYRRMLEHLVRVWRPDVLHAASDHVNARAALEVGRRLGIPVAYEVRSFHEDTWLSRHPGCADSDTYRWTRERHTEVMLAADVVTTLGEAMRAEILGRGVDPQRVVLTPNAVTQDYLSDRESDRQAARERVGLGTRQELLVGTVATLTQAEGLNTLIEATALLRAGGLDVRVLLVGDGPARSSLLARAADLGVPVAAPGRVPVAEVRGFYDALDVFVLPRADNALNRQVTALKPLEAQARAVPVVGSDLPAVREVLAPEMPVVPAADPVALSAALGALADPRERRRLGDLGHAWVASCRTWPSVTASYQSAYASLGVEPRQ